jgi:hypothetical protein
MRNARTRYDHLARALGRGLHDRLTDVGWILPADNSRAVHITTAVT